MAESASAFIIREITGDKREFRFTGRGLPYRPFTLSGTQRRDITWYGGSPEGTMQVLGAEEQPTTINGMWKDRFLRRVEHMSPAEKVASGLIPPNGDDFFHHVGAAGQQGEPGVTINGGAINNVRELAEEIDDVRRKGQLVEVLWLNLKRQGLLYSFRQSWHTAQDLQWEIQFDWINQGVQLADVPIQTRSIDLSDTIVEFATQLEELSSISDGSIELDLSATDAGQAFTEVNDGIDQIQQALLQFQDTVIVNAQAILSPISTAQRAIGILEFTETIANETANAIDRRLDSAILNVGSLFGTILDQRNILARQRRSARRISAMASIRKEQLSKQVKPELIKSFIARVDQDLRDVALQYYGAADEWRSLMHFNNLDTSRLTPKQLIFVPRNPPTAGA